MVKKFKVCGIDESGRGPVIGPMVIGCCVLDNSGKQKLKRLGVRDSKQVPAKKRVELEKEIKHIALEWNIVKISAKKIDTLRKRFSLNLVEAIQISKLILSLKMRPDKVILDSPDSIPQKFRGKVEGYLLAHNYPLPKIVSENKADDKYVECGAASILAKVARDREVRKIEDEYGICCGSGYPSDEVTKDFLNKLVEEYKVGCGKDNGERDLPDYLRMSWNTIIREKEKKFQKKLSVDEF